MSMIHQIFLAVKGGADLENIIPTGADLTLWRRMLDNYNPAAKPKRKATRKTAASTGRSPSTGSGRSKRSRKAAMDSVIGLATLKLVERVNGKTLNAWGRAADIPFQGEPGQGSDEEGTEADLGLSSPF